MDDRSCESIPRNAGLPILNDTMISRKMLDVRDEIINKPSGESPRKLSLKAVDTVDQAATAAIANKYDWC